MMPRQCEVHDEDHAASGAPVKEEELGVTLVSDIDIFNAQSTMTAMSIIWEGRTSTGCQFVKEEGQGKSSGTV